MGKFVAMYYNAELEMRPAVAEVTCLSYELGARPRKPERAITVTAMKEEEEEKEEGKDSLAFHLQLTRDGGRPIKGREGGREHSFARRPSRRRGKLATQEREKRQTAPTLLMISRPRLRFVRPQVRHVSRAIK